MKQVSSAVGTFHTEREENAHSLEIIFPTQVTRKTEPRQHEGRAVSVLASPISL